MAAVTVTFDGTRVNDANALGTLWLGSGGGKAVLEVDVVYQSGSSISNKVGTSELGMIYLGNKQWCIQRFWNYGLATK